MNSPHLFWDSCVFIRYITGDTEGDCFSDICRFVDEARAGKRKIYFSTMAFAEIRQEFLMQAEYGSIQEFFADLGSSFIPIDANPNILIAAGELRSAKSTNPQYPDKSGRPIGTADAVMLTSCLFARDVLGISDIVFHSFDTGSGKSWEGRCVPLVGFERWFPATGRAPRVAQVCGLPRSLPIHPEPQLEGLVIQGRFPRSEHVDRRRP